jgi:hypothetical protein
MDLTLNLAGNNKENAICLVALTVKVLIFAGIDLLEIVVNRLYFLGNQFFENCKVSHHLDRLVHLVFETIPNYFYIVSSG